MEEHEQEIKRKRDEEREAQILLQTTDDSRLEPPKDYEQALQKLEAEIRNHIRVLLIYYIYIYICT